MSTKAKVAQKMISEEALLAKIGANFDEAGYRRLVELSPMAIAVHVRGKLVFVNKAAAELMGGKSAKDFLGKNVLHYVHPDSQEIVKKRVALLYTQGKQRTDIIEEKLIRVDGSIIHVEIASMLFQFEHQAAVQLFIRDITERQKDREALLQAKAQAETERLRLHELLMQAPACIAILRGPNHIFELANPLYMELVGSKRKLLGSPVAEALPEIVRQGFMQLLDQTYTTGVPYSAKEVLVELDNPQKSKVYVNYVLQPSHDVNGKVDGILVHAIDVTDQVVGRQDMEYSNDLLTTVTQNASLGLMMMDENQHCTFMNAAAEKITGYTAKEVRDKPLHYYIHNKRPDGSPYPISECPIYRALPENIRQEGEEMFVRKDGTLYPVHFTASPIIKNKTPVGTVIEAQDLTGEREAQAALIESELRFRQLADSMPQMVWTTNASGFVLYRNKKWYDFTGFDPDTATIEDWRNLLHPDDVDPSMKRWQHSLKTGNPFSMETRLKDHSTKGKYRWFLVRAVPVRNADGKIVKWYGTHTDIDEIRRTTMRKQELEKIATALTEQRSQLIALNQAKDEFISLASHQLRTPATGVKQYLGMALEGYAGDLTPDLQLFLQRAYESNERQITIVNDLLQVAQVDAGKVSLAKVKTELVDLIGSVIHEQANRFAARQQTVTFKPTQKSMIVRADSGRLRMVLDNMIDNASKYTPNGKAITIKIRKSGKTIRIAIQDEGVGIKQDDIDKIFRKFSRLDNELSAHVGGSGLGLYWARKIIDLHQGTITVTSKPGQGSIFTISLPA